MSHVITRTRLQREAILYLGSQSIKKISYTDLYKYFTEQKHFTFDNISDEFYDVDLINVFVGITDFTMSVYDMHNINTSIYGLDEVDKKRQKEVIDESINNHKKDVLNRKFTVRDGVFDEYENELRLRKSEKDSKRSNQVSNWSFLIAIFALLITTFQLVIDFYDIHYGKDFKYEKTSMHLDSMQIEQNQQLIIQNQQILQLLQKQKSEPLIVKVGSAASKPNKSLQK